MAGTAGTARFHHTVCSDSRTFHQPAALETGEWGKEKPYTGRRHREWPCEGSRPPSDHENQGCSAGDGGILFLLRFGTDDDALASSYMVQHRGIDVNLAAGYSALFFFGITFGRFLGGLQPTGWETAGWSVSVSRRSWWD